MHRVRPARIIGFALEQTTRLHPLLIPNPIRFLDGGSTGWRLRRGLAAVLLAAFGIAPAQAQLNGSDPLQSAAGGPIRLRQTDAATATNTIRTNVNRAAFADSIDDAGSTDGASVAAGDARERAAQAQQRRGEFERFVGLPRFGSELVNELAAGAVDFSPVVPPEYVIQVGDEIQVTLWGSLDADLRLTVDRAGRVSIPRVGPVLVAGVRFGDLRDALVKRVGLVFKNFELSASLGRLRGVRIYVTGFVQRPGAYSVAGLSTVMNAVMRAGGPAAAGSFRQIELRRGGRLVNRFDLYELLLRGDRSGDAIVQPDDVIHVAAVGSQAALKGSVNRQAVFELKAGDTLNDVLQMAGGFSAVADRSRVTLERLDVRNDLRVVQLLLPQAQQFVLSDGDVLQAFSAVEASLSVQRQNKRVRVDGEVTSPGEFVLPANSTLRDALSAAGGLTPLSFLYGAQFTRASVLQMQQQNYDRVLRELETDLARGTASQRVNSSDEASTLAARASTNARLLDRLRELKPTGRVVLSMLPDSASVPELMLEDGDRLYVPSRPSTVGVFGSVFNAGSYLYRDGRLLEDYVSLAGGPTKGADQASVFVLRANGEVVSSRQQGGWFSREGRFGRLSALGGDTIFVPEEMDRTTILQSVKDWTLVLYQLGLGAAGISTIIK